MIPVICGRTMRSSRQSALVPSGRGAHAKQSQFGMDMALAVAGQAPPPVPQRSPPWFNSIYVFFVRVIGVHGLLFGILEL